MGSRSKCFIRGIECKRRVPRSGTLLLFESVVWSDLLNYDFLRLIALTYDVGASLEAIHCVGNKQAVEVKHLDITVGI